MIRQVPTSKYKLDPAVKWEQANFEGTMSVWVVCSWKVSPPLVSAPLTRQSLHKERERCLVWSNSRQSARLKNIQLTIYHFVKFMIRQVPTSTCKLFYNSNIRPRCEKFQNFVGNESFWFIYRGYYMGARRYEISLRVEKYFTSERSEWVKYFFNTRREISYLQAAM